METNKFKLNININFNYSEDSGLKNDIHFKYKNDIDDFIFDLNLSSFSDEIYQDLIIFSNKFKDKYLKQLENDTKKCKNDRIIHYTILPDSNNDIVDNVINNSLLTFTKLNDISNSKVEIEYNDIIIEVNNSHTLESVKIELGI